MELIHVFTTPLIEELERQGWTWGGNCVQIEADKLVVALGVKTDKPIFVDVRWNEDTLSFDTLTQETTDDGAIITEHDNGVSIKDIAEHIVDLQKVQKLDTDAIMALMLEEIKQIED
jgi:hypothetical protein